MFWLNKGHTQAEQLFLESFEVASCIFHNKPGPPEALFFSATLYPERAELPIGSFLLKTARFVVHVSGNGPVQKGKTLHLPGAHCGLIPTDLEHKSYRHSSQPSMCSMSWQSNDQLFFWPSLSPDQSLKYPKAQNHLVPPQQLHLCPYRKLVTQWGSSVTVLKSFAIFWSRSRTLGWTTVWCTFGMTALPT